MIIPYFIYLKKKKNMVLAILAPIRLIIIENVSEIYCIINQT